MVTQQRHLFREQFTNSKDVTFSLYCEDQAKLKYTIHGDKYRINNLKPGQLYRCQATTTFCQQTSARTNLIKECTG